MLRRATRLIAGLGLMGLLLGGLANQARADFQIDIYTDALLTTQIGQIIDNGAGDSNPLVGRITVSGTDLTSLNSDISGTGVEFGGLIAQSNAASPGNVATLNIGGTITGNGSLFIVTSANDYFSPAGPSYAVASKAAGTFVDTGAGTSIVHQLLQ